jgi:hypothetical protein
MVGVELAVYSPAHLREYADNADRDPSRMGSDSAGNFLELWIEMRTCPKWVKPSQWRDIAVSPSHYIYRKEWLACALRIPIIRLHATKEERHEEPKKRERCHRLDSFVGPRHSDSNTVDSVHGARLYVIR